MITNELIIAIAKGRILEELKPLFSKIGFIAEADFYDENSRKLIFSSNIKNLKIIKVRSFDVANFVKFGAADLGICGSDVLAEFVSPDIYCLLDLEIGKCRLSIASLDKNNFDNKSHISVASKYINIVSNYFAQKNIAAQCIKLNGSVELAPALHLADFIVDLISSGRTLKENNLVELDKIMDVSSHLIANRNAFKTKNNSIKKIVELFDINKEITE